MKYEFYICLAIGIFFAIAGKSFFGGVLIFLVIYFLQWIVSGFIPKEPKITINIIKDKEVK